MSNNEQTETTVESADTAIVAEPAEQIALLTAEREQLTQEKAELQNQLRYRLAEFDNFRKRSERERMEAYDYAAMDTLRPLLSVADDFERALKAVPEGSADEFVKGVQLIYNRLSDTLKKLGVEPIESVGQPFDPNVHEAMQRVETADAEDGTVLDEYQRGYNFKGKLLRPAMVRVAVRP